MRGRGSGDDGEIFRSVFLASLGPALIHRHIEHPVQAIFDHPVGACDMKKPFGRKRGTHDVVSCAGCGFAIDFALRRDPADGFGEASPPRA